MARKAAAIKSCQIEAAAGAIEGFDTYTPGGGEIWLDFPEHAMISSIGRRACVALTSHFRKASNFNVLLEALNW